MRLDATGKPEPTQNSPSYMLPGKQFISRFTGNTNASLAELIVDPLLSVANTRDFLNPNSGLTPDGRDHNPHMLRRDPAGGNAFYVDGHSAWARFIFMKMRYDPHDRDQGTEYGAQQGREHVTANPARQQVIEDPNEGGAAIMNVDVWVERQRDHAGQGEDKHRGQLEQHAQHRPPPGLLEVPRPKHPLNIDLVHAPVKSINPEKHIRAPDAYRSSRNSGIVKTRFFI